MKGLYAYLVLLFTICVLTASPALAQQKVTGTVFSGSDNAPLPGASVVIKGSTLEPSNRGTTTDADGKFTITANPNAILTVSFIGYQNVEVTIGNRSEVSVTLPVATGSLEEVVVVAYGTQKKSTLTGSVATVKSRDLVVAPIASVANAVVGRLPGLVAKQTSGQPGSDQPSLSIRGFGTPLVIVDGVESTFNGVPNFNNYDAGQIESISILKDGSASIYGARAGNGVILVTTKRGNAGKPVITLNTTYSLQGVTSMMRPAKAYQLAQIQREIHLQGGNPESTAPWKPEQIAQMKEGTGGPYYPYANTDWYALTFRDWAPQQQHNLSVRGGNEKIRYFGYAGFTDQQTMIRTGGGGFQRYNAQTNIDADITDRLSLRFDFFGSLEKRKFAIRGLGTDGPAWQDLYTTRPFYPASFPDPTKLADAESDQGNVLASTNMDISGYTASDVKDIRATIGLNYDLAFVKGLSARLLVNYRELNTIEKRFAKPYETYRYDAASNTYTLARRTNTVADLTQVFTTAPTITQNYSLNYENQIGDHRIAAIGLYEAISYRTDNFNARRTTFLTPAIEQLFAGSAATATNGGSAAEMGRSSFVARANYSFKEKYLIEGIFRADASAKFAPGSRWGYFPSASVGWVISRESFMQGATYLNNLKLRASYGQTGNDNIGNFQYLAGYNIGDFYAFNSASQQGISPRGVANPNLTWERLSIANAGLDFTFLNRKLYGELDVFYRKRSGVLATRAEALPSTFGASLPLENLNSLNDRGFEFVLGTTGRRGDFNYDITANISWSRSKWDRFEEPVYTDEDLRRINQQSGQWTDRVFGYKSDGLFTSMDEIKALPYDQDLRGNTTLRPGDIKYLDLNGDKKIDFRDRVELGKGTTPHWMVGSSINLNYRNFDLSALLQGAFGYSTVVELRGRYGGIFSEKLFEERWTEETNDRNAIVPRLGGSGLNRSATAMSDYYLKDAAYLRLKTFALGYSLPKGLLAKVGLEQCRIYVAGTNMLTWNKLARYQVDPEAPTNVDILRYYPQQRVWSFGLNLSF